MGRRKVLARNFEASTFTDDADSCFNMTRDGFSLLARASPEQGAAAPEFCGEIEAGSRGGIALSDRPAATGWNRRRCFRAGRRRSAPIHSIPDAEGNVMSWSSWSRSSLPIDLALVVGHPPGWEAYHINCA
jgi:hypothetical protein